MLKSKESEKNSNLWLVVIILAAIAVALVAASISFPLEEALARPMLGEPCETLGTCFVP
jgi:hypothetical protein